MRIEAEKTEEEVKELEEARAEEKKRKENTKVRYSLKEEWARFKAQPGEEKFWYIWEYYKLHILAIVGAIIILFMVVHSIVEATKPTILQGFQVNVTNYNENGSYMKEDYLSSRGLNPKKNHIYYDDSLLVDNRAESTNVNAQLLLASSTKIMANVQANDLDYMIMDHYSMDEYCKEQIFSDLKDVLPEEMFNRLEAEGRIEKSTMVLSWADDDKEIPAETQEIYAGVNLYPSTFTDKMGITGDCYYVFLFNSKRTDVAVDFLNYLFEEAPVEEE